MLNRNILLACLVFTLLVGSMTSCMCQISYTFNATYGQPISQQTISSYTEVSIEFLTRGTSGYFTYTDLSRSKEFINYKLPNSLQGFKFFGFFKLDMQNVKILQFIDSYFTFRHDYTFGILNVNPKQMRLVSLDLGSKIVIELDVKQDGNFAQQVVLPLENKMYMFAIMGFEKEIPAKFGVPTLVNYRASLKYDLYANLNQYLSVFVNRELTFPAHEYTTDIVNNQLPLLNNRMVEIVSFSVNPMFKQFPSNNMVLNDYQLTFNISKGFVDKFGNTIDIDFLTLECLYVVDMKQGFISYASVVFPDLQQLRCSPGVGVNNFFPKYVTIVGTLKIKNDDNEIKPLTPGQSNAIPLKSKETNQGDEGPKSGGNSMILISNYLMISLVLFIVNFF